MRKTKTGFVDSNTYSSLYDIIQGPLKQMDGIALNGLDIMKDCLNKLFEKYFQILANFIDM